MIKQFTGNLFESEAEAYVHGCNTFGRMGAGVAKEFSDRYPEMYDDYKKKCMLGEFQPGSGYIYRAKDRLIVNLGTQSGKDSATYEYVEQSVNWLAEECKKQSIRRIAMPRIASGLGGLEWELVLHIIKKSFSDSETDVEIWSLDSH
jgi:O-acetyl-ADP-ribose deacetylase (regulator of RNase III)